MIPDLQRVTTFTHALFQRLMVAIRQYPVRAALALPALVLLYVLLLVPFTPGIGDLRKAKSEAPSVLLATDGSVLAEFKRINRQWVTLEQISPHVVNAPPL